MNAPKDMHEIRDRIVAWAIERKLDEPRTELLLGLIDLAYRQGRYDGVKDLAKDLRMKLKLGAEK